MLLDVHVEVVRGAELAGGVDVDKRRGVPKGLSLLLIGYGEVIQVFHVAVSKLGYRSHDALGAWEEHMLKDR